MIKNVFQKYDVIIIMVPLSSEVQTRVKTTLIENIICLLIVTVFP